MPQASPLLPRTESRARFWKRTRQRAPEAPPRQPLTSWNCWGRRQNVDLGTGFAARVLGGHRLPQRAAGSTSPFTTGAALPPAFSPSVLPAWGQRGRQALWQRREPTPSQWPARRGGAPRQARGGLRRSVLRPLNPRRARGQGKRPCPTGQAIRRRAQPTARRGQRGGSLLFPPHSRGSCPEGRGGCCADAKATWGWSDW